MADGNSFLSIPKFDSDYAYWAMLMENLLKSKEYWNVVEDGFEELDKLDTLTKEQKRISADLRLKDLRAKNYLFQSIDKNILKTITQKTTSKELWDSMKCKYQGNVRVQRAQLHRLRREFELLQMKNEENVSEYFSLVLLVVNNMRGIGDNLQDVQVVEKILRTFSEKFNFVVCSIEESMEIDKLSVT